MIIGDTQACVTDFANRFSTDLTRPVLAEFCKVERSTAGRWLNGHPLPKGEPLVRLRIFLSLVGYQLTELGDLSEDVRNLARIIAFDVVNLDDVREGLDYDNTSEVYRLVLRASGLMPQRVRRLEALVREHKDQLDKSRSGWQMRIDELLGAQSRPVHRQQVAVRTTASFLSHPDGSLVNVSASAVGHLVAALSELLQDVDNADRVGDSAEKQRLLLLEYIGHDRLQRLMDQLELIGK